MKKHICIVGILINNKSDHAPKVQEVLTKYGTLILHRSGIPYSACDRGIINLTMECTAEELNNIKEDLSKINKLVVETLCLIKDADVLHSCDLQQLAFCQPESLIVDIKDLEGAYNG